MSPAEFKAQVEIIVSGAESEPHMAAISAVMADLSAAGFTLSESVDILNQAVESVLAERNAAKAAEKAARLQKLSELRAAGLLK